MKKEGLLRAGAILLAAGLVVSFLGACAQSTPAPTTAPKPAAAPTQVPKPADTPAPAPKPAATPAPAPKPAATPTPAPTSAPEWKPPAQFLIAASAVGSTVYDMSVAITGAISKRTGVKIGVTPAGTTEARHKLMTTKQTEFAGIGPSTQTEFALTGTYDFVDFGPLKYRVVWQGGLNAKGWATQGDSGIKKVSDIKGRKMASFPAYPGVQIYQDAFLAYANISSKDVKHIPVGDTTGGQKALLDGSAEVVPVSLENAEVKQLAASVRKIHWLPMPNVTAEDKEAWDRFHKVLPIFFPDKLYSGAGISKDNPQDLSSYTNLLPTMDWTDENLVYWFVKNMHLTFDEWKDKHPLLKQWTIDQALNLDFMGAPFHPGSIRYFKEIGRWTPAHEKRQQELLAKYEAYQKK